MNTGTQWIPLSAGIDPLVDGHGPVALWA